MIGSSGRSISPMWRPARELRLPSSGFSQAPFPNPKAPPLFTNRLRCKRQMPKDQPIQAIFST